MPKLTFNNLNQAKRKRVLKAAAREFARNDYNSANLDRIAKAAGIPKGSIYQYFHNKEDLFVFVSTTAINRLWSLFQDHLQKKPPRDCFAMYIEALRFIAQINAIEPDLTLLYIQCGFLVKDPIYKSVLSAIHGKNHQFMEKFFSWGLADGLIGRDVDRKTAVFILDALSNRFQEFLFCRRLAGEPECMNSERELNEMINSLDLFLRKAFV